ncbi:hypothetical protein PHAVU_001G186800 [Phaseolus vulgaris]|uniref:Apple domain-containing protein n=1 Tax=Phaseolus vulgaris TaxID=3885 RepID=V7D003_PHAVU|nr:hypothetical protein PHAVU_001G186800g [Phaseolus vulgaris]ESW34850.1 hypothetical protein PHAVU_001G186800g [Phaseolus vulgaris]
MILPTVMFNMLGTHQPRFMVLLFLSIQILTLRCTSITQELHTGFSATPEPSTPSFQPLLSDPTGNFSLGFLRVNGNQLALAILHVASSEPFWVANPTRAASWFDTTRLFFNGSLVLSDPETRVSWSTATNGDRAVLLNTSNLQVQTKGSPLWESFEFPTNTIVQGQNFTSKMSLLSSNGLYSLRLGNDYMGLYEGNKYLYWKRTVLETKAEVQEGKGPIYARVNPEGYLGMYQTNDEKPADVQKFNSFQQAVTAASFLFMRMEADGNLKAYYWDGSNWLTNYQAISETCELPRSCGSYGLCRPGGSGCSCLDNRTRFEAGGCFNDVGGELCGEEGIGRSKSDYWVLRRSGVEPPHKELLRHVTTPSLAECEQLCEKNCSCWGAVYNNGTGFCYMLENPIESMLGSGDESKVGYFKVKKGDREKNRVWVRVGIVITVLGMVGVIIVGMWFCVRRWKRRRVVKEEDWASPGPYKNLGSASFRSIEMSNSVE